MAKDNELPEGEDEQIVASPEDEQIPEVNDTNDQSDPLVPVAEKLGWMPKEKFKGPEEEWKPPEDFILEGKNIQKSLSRDLKAVKSQIDTMSRTSAAILAERLEDQKRQLAAQYQQAVDDGDPDKAWQATQGIQRINGQLSQTQAPSAPPAESVEFVQRNAWFNKDPLATQVALATAQAYANQGAPVHEQLAAAEREVKRAYPHLFGKPAPGVSQPGSRSATASTKAKGYNDMPREAQAVAKDMVERGVIKHVDDYSRNYWASEGKKQ